jgi:hypothetical protein
MTSLVDFNISTPRNRTQSSNECGVVINNNVSNCIPRKDPVKRSSVRYPNLDDLHPRDIPLDSPAPSVVPRDLTTEPANDIYLQDDMMYLNNRCVNLSKDLELYKEIALTFSRILKDNNKKLLANIIDQSRKIIVDKVSLCTIISKILDVPLDYVHLEYVIHTEGCLSKVLKIADIQDIKINHIDFRLGYNEKYNILLSEFNISLTRVLI